MENRYDKFTSLILNISRSIIKIRGMEMAAFGLKGNQVQLMYHLYRNKEGKSLNELCALCFEDKGALSRAISDLEGRGLVTSIPSEMKYKRPYILTEEGRELGQKIEAQTSLMVDKGANGILPEERDAFYKKLELVDNNLAQVCKQYRRKNG